MIAFVIGVAAFSEPIAPVSAKPSAEKANAPTRSASTAPPIVVIGIETPYARSVRTEEGEDLALLHLQVDAADGVE